MKITANIATFPSREESLEKMLKSIEGQFDTIRIYDNGEEEYDLTDNGKFWALDFVEDEYYFTLDDDILYPPDYVERTLKNIEDYGCIITYHGRRLLGYDRDYYTGHQAYKCLGTVEQDIEIDVCGTGVTAFDTRYFSPKNLAYSDDQRMSDLVFSLEATKQQKTIGLCRHKTGWLRHIHGNKVNIYDTESRKGNKRQNEIANEIWKLKYRNKLVV